ncbi:hypothetical protein DL96DRAFT_1614679 [Flagelloscypha sp. PMI_526]|nr:hypothetical protein DL96DRAFT_1614679 [Flagelloscypha sp. PMI_526]
MFVSLACISPMHSRAAFALLFATVVLAKKGGGSSHSSGGGGSSSTGSSSSSSSGGSSDSGFYWTPSTLSEFVLAIIYGVFTLGAGYWLAKRYNPAMTAASLTTLLWSTWGAWCISLLFYILAASWTGAYAHGLGGAGGDLLAIIQTSYASGAFEVIATVGWMFVLLAHTYTVWRTPETEIDHPSQPHILFHATLAFLALTLLFGGIVKPAMNGAAGISTSLAEAKTIYGLQVAFTLFALIAACLLLATVLVTRKTTRAREDGQSFDPLKWVLLAAVPLWVLTEFVRFVLAVVMQSRLPKATILVFEPSLLLFGIASLATIAVLPFAVVNTKKGKEYEA